MAEAWVAFRFLHFAAAMAVFGLGSFRLYAFAGLGTDLPARDTFDGVLARITTGGAVVALLSALAIVPLTAAERSGTDPAALDPAIWHAVLADTEFGHAWCWHLGFATALLALCALPRGRSQSR